MLFPTATFAVFLLVVLTLSWALMDRPRAWRPFMLAASYFFYGWWDWKFVFLLAASTLVNHVAAVAIWRAQRRRLRKTWLTAAVAFDLGLLAYFKYAGFFVSSVDNALARIGVAGASAVVNAALPVGISFYTFMAISYVVDVYRRELEPSSFSRFAVYLSFFPHLVAGPIVRGRELLPQLTAPRNTRRVDTTRAYYLILTGLFLKVVIANHLATHLVDDVFAAPNRHSSLEVLFGVYGYAVQIFAEQQRNADRDVRVAAEVGEDLDRIPVDAEEHLERGVTVRRREHVVDEMRGEVVRDHDLQEEPGQDQVVGARRVDATRVPGSRQLRQQLPAAHDRPGDEVWEEREVHREPRERRRLELAPVDVDDVRDRHEGIERDADRESGVHNRGRTGDADPRQRVVDRADEEAGVLEVRQQTEVEGDCRGEPRLPQPPALRAPDRDGCDVVHERRRGKEEDELPVPPAVEEVARRKHEGPPGPRPIHQRPGQREHDEEKDGEGGGREEHPRRPALRPNAQ